MYIVDKNGGEITCVGYKIYAYKYSIRGWKIVQSIIFTYFYIELMLNILKTPDDIFYINYFEYICN